MGVPSPVLLVLPTTEHGTEDEGGLSQVDAVRYGWEFSTRGGTSWWPGFPTLHVAGYHSFTL